MNLTRTLKRRPGECGGNHLPNFFSFCVATDDTVYDRRLACLCMKIIFPDSVNLDILRVIDIDELFVNVRAIGPGVI
jgi:hypothetical protein